MTEWPLVCDTCRTEVYVGTLINQQCHDCHLETVARTITTADREQAGIGDFA